MPAITTPARSTPGTAAPVHPASLRVTHGSNARAVEVLLAFVAPHMAMVVLVPRTPRAMGRGR